MHLAILGEYHGHLEIVLEAQFFPLLKAQNDANPGTARSCI